MLCWSLWLNRNDWLFNNKAWDVIKRSEQTLCVLNEYKKVVELARVNRTTISPTNSKWVRPMPGGLK